MSRTPRLSALPTLSRRSFLLQSGAALTLLTGGAFLFSDLSARADAKESHLLLAAMNSIYVLNLRTRRMRRISLPFLPHGFIRSSGGRVWLLERTGSSAAEFDPSSAKITRTLAAPPELYFYGHGSFDRERKRLMITAVHRTTGEGHLLGYETKNFKKISDWRIAPGTVHDCHLDGSGRLLVTSHGMKIVEMKGAVFHTGERIEPSAILSVDLESGRIAARENIEDPGQVAGHFTIDESGTVVLVTVPWANRAGNDPATGHGAVYVRPKGGDLRRIEFPKNVGTLLRGGFLSVSAGGGMIGITNPDGGIVLFLDKKYAYSGHVNAGALGVGFSEREKKFIYSGPGGVLEGEGQPTPLTFTSDEPIERGVKFVGMHLLVT